jgi:hypothetical protein
MDNFREKFESFMEGCKAKLDASPIKGPFARQLTTEEGQRYIRVVAFYDVDGKPMHRSAWAFVDKTTGDVLKAASWKKPAKHARGNIFDEWNGLKSVGPYGPAYLR